MSPQSSSRPSSRASVGRPASRLATASNRAQSPIVANGGPPPSASSTSFSVLEQQKGRPRRRSSFEVLSAIAAGGGSESLLPLPMDARNGTPVSIKEGVPTDFRSPSPGISLSRSLSRTKSRSPTRSISRIPVSSVGHARALAEDGSTPIPPPLPSPTLVEPPPSPGYDQLSPSPSSPSFGRLPHRKSIGSVGTTKVLAELQAGVSNARNALENTKSQLRLSQRLVAQLTRQNEDLKDGRERMRMENEGLNNVVARKERLLQELLERARKAESEAAALRTQLKADNANAKRSIKEMETSHAEATAVSLRSAREYTTLSESVKGLVKSWKDEVEGLKREMAVREEKTRKEVDEVNVKYKTLVKLVQATKSERSRLDSIKDETRQANAEFESLFAPQLAELAKALEHSDSDSAEALQIAKGVQEELARIRRLMRIGAGPAPSPE